MIDDEGRYMEERVCLLPEVPGVASFEAGNTTIYVHERIIRCKDCDHRRRAWNGHRPNFTSDYFCSYTGGHEVKPSDFCSHAATVGAGTCHVDVRDNLAETEGMGDVWLECDACHWQMPLEPSTPKFNFCPNCGRRVEGSE